MAKGFRRLICIAMFLAFATAMAGTACADGTRTITMIQELLNDTDFLVTYEDSGKTCYGVFHPDETITPLFLSEDATWQMLLPDVPELMITITAMNNSLERNTYEIQKNTYWP